MNIQGLRLPKSCLKICGVFVSEHAPLADSHTFSLPLPPARPSPRSSGNRQCGGGYGRSVRARPANAWSEQLKASALGRVRARGFALVVLALALLAGLTDAARAQVPSDQRVALEALYDATDGNNWTNNTNWKDSTTEVHQWYGVRVDNSKVTQLNLYENNLNGKIPAAVGNLTDLTYLDFSSNNLTGEIPAALGSLTGLTALYLDNNQLSGPISSDLGKLTGLTALYLDNNQLSGAIPPALGNLTNLTALYLDNNQLSGSIPFELGNLASLQFLFLYNNQLSGSIPSELGNLTSLMGLTVNDNHALSGEIPSDFVNLSALTFLWLDNTSVNCEPSDQVLSYFLNREGFDFRCSAPPPPDDPNPSDDPDPGGGPGPSDDPSPSDDPDLSDDTLEVGAGGCAIALGNRADHIPENIILSLFLIIFVLCREFP